MGVLAQKTEWSSQTARRYPLSADKISLSESRLPFQLTDDQKNAVKEILIDMDSGHPMNRLLQGDVGSGKTVVAKFAIQAVLENGAQAAIMAPTSILAEQHYRTLTQLLTQDELIREDEIALLIGSTPQKERPEILDKLAHGRIKVLVGTHALLEVPG